MPQAAQCPRTWVVVKSGAHVDLGNQPPSNIRHRSPTFNYAHSCAGLYRVMSNDYRHLVKFSPTFCQNEARHTQYPSKELPLQSSQGRHHPRNPRRPKGEPASAPRGRRSRTHSRPPSFPHGSSCTLICRPATRRLISPLQCTRYLTTTHHPPHSLYPRSSPPPTHAPFSQPPSPHA